METSKHQTQLLLQDLTHLYPQARQRLQYHYHGIHLLRPTFAKFTLYKGGVEVLSQGQNTVYVDTNVSAGTSYSYTLSAWDTSGNEGQKASLSVTSLFPDYTAPVIINVSLINFS